MKILEKQPHRWLKKKAWTYFSAFIRKRDKKCFTCKTGKSQNAGHWRHGHNKAGFFNETNVNGQCVRCNLHLSGNLGEYTLRMGKKYGIEVAEKMWKEFSKDHNWTRKELIEIIRKYEPYN
jgi:hypothetical protein